MFYKKNAIQPAEKNASLSDSAASGKDSIKTAPLITDSVAFNKEKFAQKRTLSGDSTLYRFVILSTHNKDRALKRYNQLLSYELKVFLQTKDSIFFKVYFNFPALSKDTAHIKDSLRREYAHEIKIER